MSTVIKSFMGMFFFILLVFSGIGLVNYQMDVNYANSYKQDVVKEIQNSNFSPSVINTCISNGTANNFEVSVDMYFADGTTTTYTNSNPAVNLKDAASACVTIKYTSRMPLIGLETANEVRGFVR